MVASEVRELTRPPLGRLVKLSPTFARFRAQLAHALGMIYGNSAGGILRGGVASRIHIEYGLAVSQCDVETRRVETAFWPRRPAP